MSGSLVPGGGDGERSPGRPPREPRTALPWRGPAGRGRSERRGSAAASLGVHTALCKAGFSKPATAGAKLATFGSYCPVPKCSFLFQFFLTKTYPYVMLL